MSEELATYEAQPVDVVRAPAEVLEEARKAASALADVVRNKKKPVIMNGEQYLEFEDWQTVAKFYGVSAKVISTEYIEFGEVRGFQARAVALNRYGMEISAAEAMCLNDEPNWKSKPLFQLKSMAQTRACAKALRNVLAWVVVLAGYKPTPAEEMTGQEHRANGQKPPTTEPQRKSTPKEPPKGPSPEGEMPVKDKLHEELSLYCQFENGEVDTDMYATVLKEISHFEKDGKEYEITDIFNERVSDKWAGSALGKLRKKLANKPE